MVYILFFSLIFLSLFFYYTLDKDIFIPPVMMTNLFLLSTLFVILNLKSWNDEYLFLSYFLIITGIIVFSLPFYIFKRINSNRTSFNKFKQSEIIKNPIKINKTIYILLIFVVLFSLLTYYYYIITFTKSVYSGANLIWYFREVTNYNLDYYVPIYIRIIIKSIDLIVYIFIYIFIYNIVYIKDKIKNNYIYLFPIIFIIFRSFMYGGRQDILRVFGFIIILSYLLMNKRDNWIINYSYRYIKYLIYSLVIGIPSFYYMLFFTGRKTTRTIFETVSTYLGGPIYHFNSFVSDKMINTSTIFGEETLISLLNTLGSLGLIDFRKPVHLEFRPLSTTIGNVYTFFRRPLHDFGILGMYIFVFIIGWIFAYIFFIKIKNNIISNYKNMTYIIVYSYIYHWIFISSIEQYSFAIISLYTFSNIFLIVLGMYLLFKIKIKIK